MDPLFYLYTSRYKSASPLSSVSPPLPRTPSLDTSRSLQKTPLPQPPRTPSFEPETIDTFCFHWPALHAYVLVRVLDHTIALLPVRSRLAAKYHRHIPSHDSQRRQPRRGTRSISPIFHDWKYTLALDKEDPEKTIYSDRNHKTTIALADVVQDANVRDGWIHADCNVKDLYSGTNAISIQSRNTTFVLNARCYAEKMMFINLIKLKQFGKRSHEEKEDTAHALDSILAEALIGYRQRQMLCELDEVTALVTHMTQLEQEMVACINDLATLDEDLKSLSDALVHVNSDHHTHHKFSGIQEHIQHAHTSYCTFQSQVTSLTERVTAHSDFLTNASRQLQSAGMTVLQRRSERGSLYYVLAVLAVLLLSVAIIIGYIRK